MYTLVKGVHNTPQSFIIIITFYIIIILFYSDNSLFVIQLTLSEGTAAEVNKLAIVASSFQC